MDVSSSRLRYGRLIPLLAVVAFVAGVAVEAVRTLPDPGLFTSATGTIVSLVVAAAVFAVVIKRPPSWLTRTGPSGEGAG